MKQLEMFPEDNIPTSVKVFHRDFALIERDMVVFSQDKHLGVFDNINDSIEYVNRGNSDTADTILHELLHALAYMLDLFESDEQQQEEHIVRALATGLTTVMRDNPKLFPVLQKIALT